jgi:transcriptional repressor NrdR
VGSGGTLAGMFCPLCGGAETRVVDSRPADQGAAIRRRRACGACGSRFTTYERAEAVMLVRKRDGRVEPFQTAKVRRGFEFALADRPIDAEALDGMVERVEQAARADGPVIDSDLIGRAVLDELRQADEVAYLRFASVYKEFQAISDFERELAGLEGE